MGAGKQAESRDALELRSIARFVAACRSRGETLSHEAFDAYIESGHSCYGQGYAEGFRVAARLIDEFMQGDRFL